MKIKKFKNKQECLEYYLKKINDDSALIIAEHYYKKTERKPFVSQRNAIITIINKFKINTENFSDDFINKMKLEIEDIQEGKSSLSKFNRTFLIHLDEYFEHLLTLEIENEET